MNFIRGTRDILAPELLAGIGHYRHRVFIDTLGWDLPTQEGIELDQFDRPDTLYVAARGDDDRLIGIARLLPTHRPYLLGDVFPQLMHGAPLPDRLDIWELSRFAAVDFEAECTGAMHQFSSPVAIALLRQVIAVAAAHQVQRLITVSPLGIERLLRRAGFVAHRAAPPVVLDGQPLFACWIEVQGPLTS